MVNDKKVKKGSSQTSRYWGFTWNNYTEDNVQRLLNLSPDLVKYIVFGYEVCPTTGTPHLQGWVEFKNAVRTGGAKDILDPVLGKASPIHMGDKDGKPSKACLRESGVLYCKKGEQTKEEYYDLGVTGPNFGKNARFEEKWFSKPRAGQGARTDWKELRDFIENNPDFDKVFAEYPEYAIRYTHGIERCIKAVEEKKNHERNVNVHTHEWNSLRKWQAKLFKELEGPPPGRKMPWYVDPKGGAGKSTFVDLLKCKYGKNAINFQGDTKAADARYAWNGQKYVTFDLAFDMASRGNVDYPTLEAIKNGRVFSGKYDSCDKMYDRPWVVIFSNWPPDVTRMAADKFEVRYLTDEDFEIEEKVVPDAEPKVEQLNIQPGNTGPTDGPAEIDNIEDSSDDEVKEAMEAFKPKDEPLQFTLDEMLEEKTDEEKYWSANGLIRPKTPKNKRKKVARKRQI